MTFSELRKALAATLAGVAVLLVVAAVPVAGPERAWAQSASAPRNGAPRNGQDEARITLNFDNADLGQIVEAVQMATHKSIIVDPRVRAQVTMRSSTPVTPQAFWEIFQSILQVHGLERRRPGPPAWSHA
jgi:general secretion pathway protein D